MSDAKKAVLERIRQVGVVPVLRAGDGGQALALAEALIEGGIGVIEVAMTVPDAVDVIRRLAQNFPEILIGAGTVLDAETTLACIEQGAQFIVSPATDPGTLEACRRSDVVAIPGALTPTEIVYAWNAGADLIKLFPSSAVGGAAYLKSIRAPLPHVRIMPSGGVTLSTVRDYLAAGAFALGAGSDLADFRAIAQGRRQDIIATARAYISAIELSRAEQAS
ncbi:MAG TPA: bifunctional 4-hydroxy-2-oxoglutarate aldolase/2-dehydro-3-deoxy-phosphogluconate aldolase [Silvibacterium sp.]|nr:bifunctional 4-hydroxy-2-oxoglutarate aldolase/2-dehydro-3-deoxy-phosphogluconate aldolase [Silvibacterium sp.]